MRLELLEMDSHTRNPELIVDLQKLAQEHLAVYSVSCALSPSWLNQALAATDAKVELPGQLRLSVTPHAGQGVLVQGDLQLCFVVPCARCLEPAHVSTSISICVNYVQKAQFLSSKNGKKARTKPSEQDEIVEFDSPDQYFFQGHEVDLQPMVSEQVLLSYPMRAFCSLGEKCRGLCSNCGANLNEQEPPGLPCIRCQVRSAERSPRGELSSSAQKDNLETSWKVALQRLQDK